MRYHNRIMNIQCDPESDYGYKEGHRDARHKAAEIASGADSVIDDLHESLCGLLTLIENNRPDWSHEEINDARALLSVVESPEPEDRDMMHTKTDNRSKT